MTDVSVSSPQQSAATPAHGGESRQLVDSVRERLASTGYHQLRRIDVAAEGDSVRLSGRVGRYYLLQIAQQAALEIEGVSALQNELEVIRSPASR